DAAHQRALPGQQRRLIERPLAGESGAGPTFGLPATSNAQIFVGIRLLTVSVGGSMSLIASRHGVAAALALSLLIAAGPTAGSRVAADNRDNHSRDRVQGSRSDRERNSRQNQTWSPDRGSSQNRSQIFTPRTSVPVPTTSGRIGTPQAAQTDAPRRPLVLGGAGRPTTGRPTVVPNGREEEW